MSSVFCWPKCRLQTIAEDNMVAAIKGWTIKILIPTIFFSLCAKFFCCVVLKISARLFKHLMYAVVKP